MRETNKCEILTGASRPDAPANLMEGGRDQRADFVLHAVALGFRDQSGFKQNLIVVIQPELPGELLLCLLQRRLFLRTNAVHLLFCKYSQRKAESCSSSPLPTSASARPGSFPNKRRTPAGETSVGMLCGCLFCDFLREAHEDRGYFRAGRGALRGKRRRGAAIDETGTDSPLHRVGCPAGDAGSVRVLPDMDRRQKTRAECVCAYARGM